MLSDQNLFIIWFILLITNIFGLYNVINKLKNKKLCYNVIIFLICVFCNFVVVLLLYKKLQKKNVKK